jgi:hypothetical protein
MLYTTIVVGRFTAGSAEDSRLFKDSEAKVNELFRSLVKNADP